MSRYVEIELPPMALEELAAALGAVGLSFARPRRRVLLEGSLECAGQPVDIRLDPGVEGTVEDFGFVLDEGRLRLVCGELDRDHLRAELLPKLERHRAELSMRAAAAASGMRVTAVHDAADGTRRLVLEADE